MVSAYRLLVFKKFLKFKKNKNLSKRVRYGKTTTHSALSY